MWLYALRRREDSVGHGDLFQKTSGQSIGRECGQDQVSPPHIPVYDNLTVISRNTLIVEDDPEFDPMLPLKPLKLSSQDLDLLIASQGSTTSYSQMTPRDALHLLRNSSARQSSVICIDLPHSSHSVGSFQLPSDLRGQSSPVPKMHGTPAESDDILPFPDDFDLIEGIGLDFDGDGNLISLAEQAGVPRKAAADADAMDIDDPFLFNDMALPDAEAFTPTATSQKRAIEAAVPDRDALLMPPPPRPVKRRRVVKSTVMLDETISIRRSELSAWAKEYATTMRAAALAAGQPTAVQAKKAATAFVMGNGVNDIGTFETHFGIKHQLAEYFSGDELLSRALGKEPAPEDEDVDSDDSLSLSRGRDNRQRPRFETPQKPSSEIGRGGIFSDGIDLPVLGDDLAEIGLDAVPPMADRHSSSGMPWSRAGSAAPSSSVKGSAKKSATAPSPLHARRTGFLVSIIERQSDPAEGSVGHGLPLDFPDSSLAEILPLEAVPGLTGDSREFLEYTVQHMTAENTYERLGRRWIEFKKLADPENDRRHVAAQAFLHILGLATNSVVKVHQDGREDDVPFGKIHIGIRTEAAQS